MLTVVPMTCSTQRSRQRRALIPDRLVERRLERLRGVAGRGAEQATRTERSHTTMADVAAGQQAHHLLVDELNDLVPRVQAVEDPLADRALLDAADGL